MDWYLLTRTIHIISSTILFGTGLGIAFFMWWTNRNGDLAAKVFVAKTVVIADFLFTLPAVIIQPITGIILVNMVGYDYKSLWLVLTYLGYIIAGICWVPVVYIQIRLRNIAKIAIEKRSDLPAEYYRLFKLWFILGWPAFISLLGIFFLMVFKPI